MIRESEFGENRCWTCGRNFNRTAATCPYDSGYLMAVHHNSDVEDLLKDRYSIVDRVSHSRQADVYVARGESDRAPYVVKVSPIPNEAAYSEVVGFAEELKKLCHPAMCRVIEHTVLQWRFVSILEYARGNPLTAVKLPLARLLRLLEDVADGLQMAHDNGIVHGNISPSNIVWHEDQDAASISVKLCGFSPFRFRDHTQETGMAGTATSYLGYSATYSAPFPTKEPGTDIYSLACVLFEGIVGAPPYLGAHAFDTALLHRNAPVPVVTSLLPGLRGGKSLDELFQRALAKETAQRFTSMAEFRDAVKNIRTQDLGE